MILEALYRRYRHLSEAGELPPFGFSTEKVVAAVALDPTGRVTGLIDLRTDAKLGKSEKIVKRPAQMEVPQPPKRTSGVRAGFLCDNAAYLFGLAGNGKAGREEEQFRAAKARHEAVLAGVDHPAARAVLDFFAMRQPGTAPDAADPELLTGWLVFQVEGHGFAHRVPEIRAAWERAADSGDEDAAVTGQCLVTGTGGVPIPPTHPAVKGVPGAQSSGAALVSFNAPAYESYGRTQNHNAPVSAAVAHGYTAALNDLLARRGKHHVAIDDVSVVFWTEAPTAIEDDFAQLFSAPVVLQPDEGAQKDLAARMQRLARGQEAYPLDQRGVPFHLLGLSANAARLAVRFWASDTVGVIADRVARHLADCRVVTEWKNETGQPSVRALAEETKVKIGKNAREARPAPDDKGIAKLEGDLMRAVVTGGPYPASLLAVLLDRIRADRVVNHRRAALIKAVLVRRARLSGRAAPEEGDRLVALDETRSDPGYLLGRLFAVLERIQQLAAEGRELNATIRDRHIGAASATPRAVFPHLLRLSAAHMKRLRAEGGRKLSGWYDGRIEEIQSRLDDYPAVLDMEQRGLFFLGYYHQRRALWTKKDGPAGDPGADLPDATEPDPAAPDLALALPE